MSARLFPVCWLRPPRYDDLGVKHLAARSLNSCTVEIAAPTETRRIEPSPWSQFRLFASKSPPAVVHRETAATTNGTVGLLQPQPAAGEPGDRRTNRWSTDNLCDDAVTLTTRRGRQSPLTTLVQEVQPEVFCRPQSAGQYQCRCQGYTLCSFYTRLIAVTEGIV